jgi:hypothetical protein
VGISNLINKPFALQTALNRRVRTCLLFGLFVFLFLIAFQPFRLAETMKDTSLLSLGYGITTVVVMAIMNVLLYPLFPHFFNEEKWTVGREFAWSVLNIAVIGLANTLFTVLAGIAHLSVANVLVFEGYTLLVAVFPVSVSILARQIHLAGKYEKTSELINAGLQAHPPIATPVPNEPLIDIPSDNAGENLSLNADDLFYVRSSDNYIEVYYCHRGSITKKLLRSTLKKLESTFEAYPQLFRCHKSYIVNLDKVKHVSGNAQGYKLHLTDSPDPIPVSRQYNDAVKDRFAANP